MMSPPWRGKAQREPWVTSKTWSSPRLRSCLVPPKCWLAPSSVGHFPSQAEVLLSLPCLVWVTEQWLQPAGKMLHSQVQGGGWVAAVSTPRPPAPRASALHGALLREPQPWLQMKPVLKGLGTKRKGRTLLFSLPVLIWPFSKPGLLPH